MRKSFDGLPGLVSGTLEQNVMSEDIYIFIYKTRNRTKLPRWVSDGFMLFYKRLERGTFELP
ncbi:MAG: IS66 family insertion sequence element accessory protein TnpB, partial [Chloroflexi bacterium]|nr:IS66 family insertion sequence element accessory protein TnpB [Chloroflexota bacterium]